MGDIIFYFLLFGLLILPMLLIVFENTLESLEQWLERINNSKRI